jgi:3,4-dihydroxy 2-butanone 4-phosphate synthase/GTP cyclohydrolase II
MKQQTKPMHGQVIYLATTSLETRFGVFRADVFQDLHSKEYCIALSAGSLKSKAPLLARIHSSCLTSETLRGLDSDDIQQLELALKLIAGKKRGILYYLIQEGRGIGFTAKARDRMLVQYYKNLSSHDAFKLCGLKDDYRLYDVVHAINVILGIEAPLQLLTNSPHKLAAITAAGISVAGTQGLEVQAYHQAAGYLDSKRSKGHTLSTASKKSALTSNPYRYLFEAPAPHQPFLPYQVEGASRFIHTASYNFPIKPVGGDVILSKKTLERLLDDLKKVDTPQLYISHVTPLPYDRFRAHLDRSALKSRLQKKNSSLAKAMLSIPYWFTLHAYYDVALGQDFILLEYGNVHAHASPLVRIQSESLFNRFPLEDVENRDKFKKSLLEIVQAGAGIILLLQHDGRGAGFGIFALEQMMVESGVAKDSNEAYKLLGLSYDSRDYYGAALLIGHRLKRRTKHHGPSIDLLVSSAESLARKPESLKAFVDAGIVIGGIRFLE